MRKINFGKEKAVTMGAEPVDRKSRLNAVKRRGIGVSRAEASRGILVGKTKQKTSFGGLRSEADVSHFAMRYFTNNLSEIAREIFT